MKIYPWIAVDISCFGATISKLLKDLGKGTEPLPVCLDYHVVCSQKYVDNSVCIRLENNTFPDHGYSQSNELLGRSDGVDTSTVKEGDLKLTAQV